MVKDLLKQLQGQDSGQWANNKVSGLDRTLGEISRILEKQVEKKKKKGCRAVETDATESKIFSSCRDHFKNAILLFLIIKIAFVHLHLYLKCNCLELFELYMLFILICKLVFSEVFARSNIIYIIYI